jgi:hypothetical protein
MPLVSVAVKPIPRRHALFGRHPGPGRSARRLFASSLRELGLCLFGSPRATRVPPKNAALGIEELGCAPWSGVPGRRVEKENAP